MKLSLANISIAIERQLVLKVVEAGYYPDESTFTDMAAFQAAKEAIKETGKKLIEVKGVGSFESRGEMLLNQITIDFKNRKPSNFGHGVGNNYSKNGDRFDVTEDTKGSFNCYFEINYICKDAFYASIIEELITAAYDIRVYLYGMDEELTVLEQGFPFEYSAQYDKSGSDYIEKTYWYTAFNLQMKEFEPLPSVSELKEISTELQDLEGNTL